MDKLNLPEFTFKLNVIKGKNHIFDVIRKKYVILTDEEWVRQHFIHFLMSEYKYPSSMIVVEKSLRLNQLDKRADILVYNKFAQPSMLVECKAPSVKIGQDVFDQIARYNMVFKVSRLVVTNGLKHFVCNLDFEKNDYLFIKEIPIYDLL